MAVTLLPGTQEKRSMDLRPQVLIVADTLALAEDLDRWLVPGGYQSRVATTFASAMIQLRTLPHLVISQLRLGAYNGLHVALRARRDGIPAVVIGKPDMVLERDARQLGATFVTSGELERERILAVVQALIPAETAGIPALSRGEEEQQVGVPEVLSAMLSDCGRPDYTSH